jgi:hypothetical protein
VLIEYGFYEIRSATRVFGAVPEAQCPLRHSASTRVHRFLGTRPSRCAGSAELPPREDAAAGSKRLDQTDVEREGGTTCSELHAGLEVLSPSVL